MQVSLENTNPLERRMTVSLPAERLDGVVGKRLQEIARTARLKGFRPGKIPTKVIEQRFGTQVREEVLGELIRTSFDEAIRQEHVQPAGNPDIKNEDVKTEDLPENMRAMTMEQRKAYVAEMDKKRADINTKVADLNAKRGQYVEAEMKKMA